MRTFSIKNWLVGIFVAFLAIACGAEETITVQQGDVAAGQASYEMRCSQCHGSTGDGDGPGKLFMHPRPRAFKDSSAYKFRSTKTLPTDLDLFRVISEGLPGTSMPGFDILPEQERWDLVAFLKTLSTDFADPEMAEETVAYEELVNPKAPEMVDGWLAEGRAIYEEQKCAQCHGESGLGNGKSWRTLYFRTDTPYQKQVFPANLANVESYRNGSDIEDIFRTVTTGLVTMPSYRDSLNEEQRWKLAYYVRSLGTEDRERPDETVVASRVEKTPETSDAEVWDTTAAARFKTFSNIIEPPRLFFQSVEYVNVQALYDDENVTLRVQWDDRSESKGTDDKGDYADWDTKVYLGTDHPDQMVLQFPSKENAKKRPYFMMGWAKDSVNLWWWRADDAEAFVEKNAKGIAAISEQSERSQDLQGKVTYFDGRYTMLIKRPLTTQNTKGDVQFAPGVFVPIAFHVWDGDRGEVGQRRGLTSWNWIYLKPAVPEDIHHMPVTLAVSLFVLLLGLFTYIRRKHAAGDKPKS